MGNNRNNKRQAAKNKPAKQEEVATATESTEVNTTMEQSLEVETTSQPQPPETPSEIKDVPDVEENVIDFTEPVVEETHVQKELKEYEKLCKTKIITPSIQKAIIAKLANIIQYILVNDTFDNFDEFYGFFASNRTGLLSPERVFVGIENLPKSTSMKIECFYTAIAVTLRNRTAKKKSPLNVELLRDVLGSEEFIQFIGSKNR